MKFISYYDKKDNKFKTIDVIGKPHWIDGEKVIPHTHKGKIHDEKGTYHPSPKEQKMIDRAVITWENVKNEE